MSNHRAVTARLLRPSRAQRSCGVLVAGGMLALLGPCGGPSRIIAATLPIPCAAGACKGVTGPQTWVTSGSAKLVQVGNAMTITQGSENAVLNWQSFNI